ncbi:Ig-like domain-containing protein [Paenibacillus sp. PL91]|uniref:Ig-like domain-containing protein n=1 Tax=Paenibacillus sp. PL91 TaxID=2729538 RepID=UPI00145CD446|nr:Ig-like domain-containing protein [Paenibacillus sp. PL91]MBC9201892.1 Ig-like domain-containing protein [Paenibacillus sp. PL91]
MSRTSKLSSFIAVMLFLQITLASWPLAQQATAASAGPVVLSLSPADDLINVSITAVLKMTFDENVSKGSHSTSISIYDYATSNLVERIPLSSNQISIDGSQRTVTIDPTNYFDLNTNYYVLVDAGAFVNASNGAGYAGINSASSWNFRTVAEVDVTSPTHTGVAPTASPIAVTTPIIITFNEPVYVASGNIQINSVEDNRSIAVTSNAVRGSGTNQIVIQPPAALQPSTAYSVTIPNTAFQDASGNLFNGVTWSFTTDTAPVNVAALIPADNATSVAPDATLIITFDKNVQPRADKFIEIRRISNNTSVERFSAISSNVIVANNQVSFKPTSNLEANTAYYVLIDAGAFTQPDPSGDQWYHGIAGASVWNFSTNPGNENVPPAATAVMPAAGGTISSLNSLLQITFNEPVFLNRGAIEIRDSATGALFRSIPVTSERITGGGTYQITIDPNKAINGEAEKAFVNNTKYYVTIGNRAIRDAAENYYAGISDPAAWSFTVSQDTVRPTLSLLNPLNNAVSVGLSQAFTATFSEAIKKGATGSIIFNPIGNSTLQPIPGNFYVDGNNNNVLVITPTKSFDPKTAYYVTVDASAVTDLAGNNFAGILNEYQWTFQTYGSDNTAPVLSKLEWSGSTITLTYNEELNVHKIPSAGSFYVTVNGAPRSVTGVQVRGDAVILTVESPIVAGQQVKLSYSKATIGLIQDTSDNEAASIVNQDVSGAKDVIAPTVISGNASGSAITLSFNKELLPVNSYAYLQFSVSIGGVKYSTTSISSSGSNILLTINGSVQNYQNVYVTYVPGSHPIRDKAGNYLAAFNNYSLYSVPDSGKPTLQYISVSSNIVTLKYNKNLNTQSVPAVGQFNVMVDSSVRPVQQVTIAGDTVLLTLSSIITNGQVVSVTYLAAQSLIMDLAGNTASSFTNVTSGSGSSGGQNGTIYGVIAKGYTITLTFAESLNSGYVPAISQFLVNANSAVRLVSRVELSGSSVMLRLAAPVATGEAVTITYYSNSTGLRTNSGTMINSFSNISAANQTTILDGLSGDYEESAGGGIGLKTSAATTTTDTSPAGVQANRYTLPYDKLLTAFQTVRTAGIATPRVAFKVPASENAAIVSVPISTLDMANRINANSIFAVQYGDATYELQLTDRDFAKINTLLSGNSSSGQLLIRIDQGSSMLTGNLSSKINSSNSSMLAGPYHFDVTAVSGSVQKPLNDFNGYVPRTIQTYQAVDTSKTAVVWLDPALGELSYVPTELTTTAGKTTATFKRKGNSSYALVTNTSSFSDLTKHWAAANIHTLSRKFIVEGRTASKFEPNRAITRGEFATYIAKGLGLSSNREAAAKYKDVNTGTVMGAYIGAASAAGIVAGNTDGTFKPNNPITRQEMAAMMIRAASVAGLNVQLPQSAASYLQKYADRSKVSSWAKTDVAKSIYIGVISGKTATTLSPQTNATRAEGSVMLLRLLQKVKFLTP